MSEECVPNGFSVVVPTRGRPALVEAMLSSLSEARLHCELPVEVIVVDDSEADDADRIESACGAQDATYLKGPESVRAKRNLGIEKALYDHVLFIDSDCVADPEIFRYHARALADAPFDAAGTVGVTEFVGEDSWNWNIVKRTQFLNAFSFARRLAVIPWSTCTNVCYRRTALEAVGGFEENWPFRLGADDADLGLRLGKRGRLLLPCPDAVVQHTRETWAPLTAVIKRAFRWGAMDIHLYFRRHQDRLAIAPPKLTVAFLLLLITSIILGIKTQSLSWLLVAPLWLAAVMFLRAFLTVQLAKERLKDIIPELLADFVGLAFETGAVTEGLRRGEFAILYKSVVRGPVLPTFARIEWVVQSWSVWIGLLLILLFVMVD